MSQDPTGSDISGKIVLPAETVADEQTDRNQYIGSYHDTTKQNGPIHVRSDTLFKVLNKSHRSESRFGGSDSEPLDLAIPLPSRYRMSMDSLIINDRILYRFNGENPYTGVVVDLWDNGNKRFEGTYMIGKEDGKHTEWYKNGQKEKETTWSDGVLNGEWAEWFENGQSMFEGSYMNGVIDGPLSEWYSNGQKKEEGTISALGSVGMIKMAHGQNGI